jgi:alkaline phosphatase
MSFSGEESFFVSRTPDMEFLPSGGAEQFIAGPGSPNGTDYYKAFQAAGYNVIYNKTQLLEAGNDRKTLGIFSSKCCVSMCPKYCLFMPFQLAICECSEIHEIVS